MPLFELPSGKILETTDGKAIDRDPSDPCCCGPACDTCDACTTPEGMLVTLTLHLPLYPGDGAQYYSDDDHTCHDSIVGGVDVEGVGPWTRDNNGDPCYRMVCEGDPYDYDTTNGWHLGTQGDVTLSLTLQRCDTLGYDDATVGAAFGVPAACCYLLFESPGTHVVAQSYQAPAACVVTEEFPLVDPLDLIVVLIRRENDNIGDSFGHCCSQWELSAWLGIGNPLTGGGGVVFNLYNAFFADLDNACSLPVTSLACDPATYTDCSGTITPDPVCYLKQNYTLEEDCWHLDTGSSCGSATFDGS